MDPLNAIIDNLDYSTVEDVIANYYDMGHVQSSSLPIIFSENERGTFSITATRKLGVFSIRVNKRTDQKYQLYVTVNQMSKT